jgi:hypothetical protein
MALTKNYRGPFKKIHVFFLLIYLIVGGSLIFSLIKFQEKLIWILIAVWIIASFMLSLNYLRKVRIVDNYILVNYPSASKISEKIKNKYLVNYSPAGRKYKSSSYSYVFTLDNVENIKLDNGNVIVIFKNPLTYESMLGKMSPGTEILKLGNKEDISKVLKRIEVEVANPQQLLDDMKSFI